MAISSEAMRTGKRIYWTKVTVTSAVVSYSLADNTAKKIPWNSVVNAWKEGDLDTTNRAVKVRFPGKNKIFGMIGVTGDAGDTTMDYILQIKNGSTVIKTKKGMIPKNGTIEFYHEQEGLNANDLIYVYVTVDGNASAKAITVDAANTYLVVEKM